MKKLINLITHYGGKYEECRYDDSVHINVSAPDGMQWRDGNCLNMLEIYYPYIKGDRYRAINTLYIRILNGIENINYKLNP